MKKNIKVGLYFQSLSRKGGGAEKNIIWLSNELQKNNNLFKLKLNNSKQKKDTDFVIIGNTKTSKNFL